MAHEIRGVRWGGRAVATGVIALGLLLGASPVQGQFDDAYGAAVAVVDGRIAVLCFHGIPAIEHPWVHTDPAAFETYMKYLKDEGCTVIAMRDLGRYVDPRKRPHKDDPYVPVRKRTEDLRNSK